LYIRLKVELYLALLVAHFLHAVQHFV